MHNKNIIYISKQLLIDLCGVWIPRNSSFCMLTSMRQPRYEKALRSKESTKYSGFASDRMPDEYLGIAQVQMSFVDQNRDENVFQWGGCHEICICLHPGCYMFQYQYLCMLPVSNMISKLCLSIEIINHRNNKHCICYHVSPSN